MICDTCKTEMVVRESRTGKFYACPRSYPGNNHGTKTHSQTDEQYNTFKRSWIGIENGIDELRDY